MWCITKYKITRGIHECYSDDTDDDKRADEEVKSSKTDKGKQ